MYEAANLAHLHRAGWALHPIEYYRLCRATWITGVHLPKAIMGVKITIDPQVPEGVLRVQADETEPQSQLGVALRRAQAEAGDDDRDPQAVIAQFNSYL